MEPAPKDTAGTTHAALRWHAPQDADSTWHSHCARVTTTRERPAIPRSATTARGRAIVPWWRMNTLLVGHHHQTCYNGRDW